MSLEKIAHLKPRKILDIGANVGGWFKEAKAVWPEARIVLIEGNEACRPYLEQTGADFVITYLGQCEKKVQVFKRKGGGTDTGNSYYRELTPFFDDDQIEVEEVKLRCLDELIDPEDKFDFIKIDTQGSELDVMNGGRKICRNAKHILLEVTFVPYNAGAPLAEDVFAFMTDLGFLSRTDMGDIVHPITRGIIQKDILFSR